MLLRGQLGPLHRVRLTPAHISNLVVSRIVARPGRRLPWHAQAQPPHQAASYEALGPTLVPWTPHQMHEHACWMAHCSRTGRQLDPAALQALYHARRWTTAV